MELWDGLGVTNGDVAGLELLSRDCVVIVGAIRVVVSVLETPTDAVGFWSSPLEGVEVASLGCGCLVTVPMATDDDGSGTVVVAVGRISSG